MVDLNFDLKNRQTLDLPEAPAAAPGSTGSTGLGTAATSWDTGRIDDGVEKRVTSMMSKDSPLMRQAETAGLQLANKRGLLNSSMAVGAVQNEGYRAALPIASQEASQAANENMTNLNIASNFGLQENDIRARQQLANDDIAARKEMQAADIAYNTGRDQINKKIAEMGNDTEQQRIMSSYMVSQEQIYSARLSDIMNNTNLTAAQRQEQIDSAKKSFTGHLDAIGNILTVDVTDFMLWDGPSASQLTAAKAAQAQAVAAAANPAPASVAAPITAAATPASNPYYNGNPSFMANSR